MSYTRVSASRVFLRDAILAMLTLVGLIALIVFIGLIRQMALPGYLILLSFHWVRSIVGLVSSGPLEYLLFALYLIGLGVIGATIATVLRKTLDTDVAWWRFGLAGGFAVMGILSLLASLQFLILTSEHVSIYISGTLAVVMVVLAAWAGGFFGKVSYRR